MNNGIKIILGIIGTILLGAIGSGLWDRFLSGFFDSVVNVSVELVNLIFKTYKDGIYETASLGFHESYSLIWIMLVISLMPLMYIQILRKHPVSGEKRKKVDNKTADFIISNNGYKFILALTLTVLVLSIFIVSKVSYTNRVITYSIRSLDVVKPFVGDKKHALLLSQFYQVRDTDDYDAFHDLIKTIARENELRLPENEPL